MASARETLARRVLRDNLRAKKGESVVIESWAHTLPYATAFVEEARRIGAQPTLLYEDEAAWWKAVRSKQFGPFAHLSKAEKAAVAAADVYVYFWGPEDFGKAANLPGDTGERVTAWNPEWYSAAKKGGLRGVRMSLGFLGNPVAKKFGFDGGDLREKVAEAGATDAGTMAKKGRKVVERLRRGKQLRVRHGNGTDLRINLKGIKSRVDVGIVDDAARKLPRGMLTNNPTGLILSAVDQSQASGTIVGNRAVYDLGTFERSDGARWTLARGHLTEHAMGEGAAAFDKAFKRSKKGFDQLGYFSIGLNPASKGIPPAEDTEEGAVLLSVGNNELAGGRNKVPFRGYAMIGGATVEVDGRPIVRAGRIL
jgi:aminopeptidase